MNQNIWVLVPIICPSLAGLVLLILSGMQKWKNLSPTTEEDCRRMHIFSIGVLAVSGLAAIITVWSGDFSLTVFYLMKEIPVYFQVDDISRTFVTLITVVWTVVAVYASVYMPHEGEEERFFGFYLIVYGVLMGLCVSGNLVTFYLFYELMTLTSAPLVLHNGSREATMASLKYLFYSMCGAYCALFGIFYLYPYTSSLTFTAGGTLNLAAAAGHESILLAAVFMMLVGFGVKAGMFPMHAWLPAAHPVAPSPASAVLSGIIVKCGVLGVIRTVFYIVGPDFIRGTWVQIVWMILILITIFMGSLLAYREKVFKKRLAYSSVSQASYILFGISTLSASGLQGALLHVVFHAFIKCTLFLTAGTCLFLYGKTRVEDLRGIGRQMPKTLWCFTFAALALIGIPPASGFISKWYLANGALEAGIGVFGCLGPVILLLSALLTAGYLLPITIQGFFPGENAVISEKKEAPIGMLLPMIFLAGMSVVMGIFPGPLISFFGKIAAAAL